MFRLPYPLPFISALIPIEQISFYTGITNFKNAYKIGQPEFTG